ncbi:TPA: hypothetical protein L6B19_18095 [Pseudomonas aeruginosa]|nr:hypothetical protein [Pseudomonas aeruginosa]
MRCRFWYRCEILQIDLVEVTGTILLIGQRRIGTIVLPWRIFQEDKKVPMERLMLIKIPDADDDFVARLKAATFQTTGSKAYAKAAEAYQPLKDEVDKLRAELASVRRELQSARQTIEGARSAAAQLLERVAQGDLGV